jgi:copper transport protein
VRPALLRRFGALAASCVVVLAVTGLLMAADQVATVDAALYSWYGRTLLLKLGLAVVAGILGLTSTLLLRPRWSELVLRRRVPPAWAAGLLVAEAATLVVVLGLAGGLASEQPARGTAWTPVRTSGPVMSGNADDLVEQLSLSPNSPGRTFLTVGVYDSRRPAPARIDRVLVTLSSPEGRSVTRAAAQGGLTAAPTNGAPVIPDGWVVAGDDVTTAGPWQLTVRVQRSGLRDAVATYSWMVPDGAARPHPVRVSDHPLGGLLRGAAVLVLVALVALLLALALPRGPFRIPAPTLPPAAESDVVPHDPPSQRDRTSLSTKA